MWADHTPQVRPYSRLLLALRLFHPTPHSPRPEHQTRSTRSALPGEGQFLAPNLRTCKEGVTADTREVKCSEIWGDGRHRHAESQQESGQSPRPRPAQRRPRAQPEGPPPRAQPAGPPQRRCRGLGYRNRPAAAQPRGRAGRGGACAAPPALFRPIGARDGGAARQRGWGRAARSTSTTLLNSRVPTCKPLPPSPPSPGALARRPSLGAVLLPLPKALDVAVPRRRHHHEALGRVLEHQHAQLPRVGQQQLKVHLRQELVIQDACGRGGEAVSLSATGHPPFPSRPPCLFHSSSNHIQEGNTSAIRTPIHNASQTRGYPSQFLSSKSKLHRFETHLKIKCIVSKTKK